MHSLWLPCHWFMIVILCACVLAEWALVTVTNNDRAYCRQMTWAASEWRTTPSKENNESVHKIYPMAWDLIHHTKGHCGETSYRNSSYLCNYLISDNHTHNTTPRQRRRPWYLFERDRHHLHLHHSIAISILCFLLSPPLSNDWLFISRRVSVILTFSPVPGLSSGRQARVCAVPYR